MRVQNKNITIRSVIFSKTFALVYFLIMCFFIYKSYSLYNIWNGHYKKNIETRKEYEDKELQLKDLQDKRDRNHTDLGKERYEKEFFNKLDDGEEMIVLYSGEVGKSGQEGVVVEIEKPRHMFFWEKWYLDTIVWWRNWKIF